MEWSVDHSQVICDKIILAYLKQSTFARQIGLSFYLFIWNSVCRVFVFCLALKCFIIDWEKWSFLAKVQEFLKLNSALSTLSSFFTKSVVDEIELKLKDSFECDVHDNDVER